MVKQSDKVRTAFEYLERKTDKSFVETLLKQYPQHSDEWCINFVNPLPFPRLRFALKDLLSLTEQIFIRRSFLVLFSRKELGMSRHRDGEARAFWQKPILTKSNFPIIFLPLISRRGLVLLLQRKRTKTPPLRH